MRAIKLIILAASLTSGLANAQMWGTGMYGGMGVCPYPYGAGAGATNGSDVEAEMRQQREKARRELTEKQRKLSDLRRKMSTSRTKISKVLKGGATNQVIAHMDHPHDASSYAAGCGKVAEGDTDTNAEIMPVGLGGTANEGGSANYNAIPTADDFCYANGENAWPLYAEDGGIVNGEICNQQSGVRHIKGNPSSSDRRACVDGLDDYQEAAEKARNLQAEIESLEQQVDDFDELIEEERERMADAATEAQGCIECYYQRRGYVAPAPSAFATIANIGMNVLGGYLAYQGAKYATDQNAKLGWPTSPYMAAGMAYPFLMNGVYGAIGGGIGAGAFGCAPGAGGGGFPGGPYGMASPYGMMGAGMYGGMGGPFGYPQGFFGSPMGGGMMMPGMYPGGGYPYGGFGMPGMGGFGFAGGIGMMGMPGMGMAGMAGYPGMPGMGMAGMAGYPGMAGFAMPGMAGAGGFGFAGMPGMGMAGMMGYPGMPGMGMAGMAGYPGMPGMGMAGMAGYPGMAGMAGMMAPMMGMPGMGMEYQQQMMQQYMGQMQAQMAYQQRVQQDYMARQQTIMSLQQELYRIQSQIQQISYGSYGGAPSVLPYPSPTGPSPVGPTPGPTSPVIRNSR